MTGSSPPFLRRRAFLRTAVLIGTAGGAAFLISRSDPRAGLPCRRGSGCRSCNRIDSCRLEPAVRWRHDAPIPDRGNASHE
jgi:hypothetical protein